MKQRPPATDLSGPKASAESLTPRRSNFAAENAVDFQFGLLSSATALGSALSPEPRTAGPRLGMAEVPTLSGGMIRGGNWNDFIHVLSGSPLCGMEVVDGEG